MKTLYPVLFCACLIVSVCCAGIALAEPTATVTGGYSKIQAADKDAADALSYLKKNFPALGIESIDEAYRQVVAGINIKLLCKVSHGSTKESWELVIYRDLKGDYHFTSAKAVKR